MSRRPQACRRPAPIYTSCNDSPKVLSLPSFCSVSWRCWQLRNATRRSMHGGTWWSCLVDLVALNSNRLAQRRRRPLAGGCHFVGVPASYWNSWRSYAFVGCSSTSLSTRLRSLSWTRWYSERRCGVPRSDDGVLVEALVVLHQMVLRGSPVQLLWRDLVHARA